MILGARRAGLVDRRELAAWMAREAAFTRRGEGVSTASRLLAALLASVAGREAAPYLKVARALGDELAGAAQPAARWLLDMHLAVGDFCHGRGELARLWVELGTADLSEATAYSDSASDLPLLNAAGRAVAVNPDRRLRRAAVEAGWPVVRLT